MKTNPYAGAQMVLRNGDPIENMRTKGGQLALSSATGEFNANDKRDLINQISGLMAAVASGEVCPVEKSARANSQEVLAQRQENMEVMASAISDTSGQQWSALGASMATRITEQVARDGFMRRMSVGSTLKQGEQAQVLVSRWNCVAIQATSSSSVGHQLIRQKRLYPTEFELTANLRVEQLELEQVAGDLLEELYQQGLDSIITQEDRMFKRAADMTVGMENPINYIAGQLTPQVFSALRTQVTDWNLPATTAILSNDFWNDIIGNNDFVSFLDPVNKYDLALHGRLGTLIGMELLTDGFRQENQKVLERGEIYVVTSPENLAAYTDRGGVRATPTNGADAGNTTRGWLLNEILSFILANPRGVAKGKRLA